MCRAGPRRRHQLASTACLDTVKKRTEMAAPAIGQPIRAATTLKGLFAKNSQPILYRIPGPFHDSYSAKFHIVEVNSVWATCMLLSKKDKIPAVSTYIMDRDSSDSKATRYWLDGLGIKSGCGRYFPHPSRPAVVPTQLPIQWVMGNKVTALPFL